MTKLYNTSFREQEGKYVIDGYTEKKPTFDDDYLAVENPYLTRLYINKLMRWEESKQSIEVHESQVERFVELANNRWGYSGKYDDLKFSEALKQGIEIPDEMVEIREVEIISNNGRANFGKKQYAFLKQETKDKAAFNRLNDIWGDDEDGQYEKMYTKHNKGEPFVGEESQDELWQIILTDITNWFYSEEEVSDTDFKQILKSKFTITKKQL